MDLVWWRRTPVADKHQYRIRCNLNKTCQIIPFEALLATIFEIRFRVYCMHPLNQMFAKGPAGALFFMRACVLA